MLLKNDKLRELVIRGFNVSGDNYQQFKEALRSRKNSLTYTSWEQKVTLKQFIELNNEFGNKINFNQMKFILDESIDKQYLNLLN